MALTHQTDHEGAALDRLAAEFRKSPTLAKLIRAFASEVQAVEEAAWQLYTERGLDVAVGAQLDLVGKKLDEPRGDSADDDEYRLRLRGKIRVLKSSGRTEDLLAMLRAVDPDADEYEVQDRYPKAVDVVVVKDSMPEREARVLRRFLSLAKAAGERVMLEWTQLAEAETLYTARATFLDGPHTTGATTLDVLAIPESFPDSGTLLIDAGVPGAQEAVTYTGRTDTSFTGVSALANNHQDRAAVSAVLPESQGLGIGDAEDEGVGGGLAFARSMP